MDMMWQKKSGIGSAGQSGGQSSVLAKGRLVSAMVLLLSLGAWSGNAYSVTCTSTAAGGNWNATGTWTGCAGGGGTPANTPGAADNVIIATTGAGVVAVNVQAAMTNLTINFGSILNVVGGSNFRIRPSGATSISGALNLLGTSTSSSRFTGLVTVAGTGTWSNSGNQAVTFRGGITNNGTFSGGTGTQTFNTNSQALGGSSPINFGGIVDVVGAVTVTNNGIVTIANNLTGSVAGSTWVNAANSTLNYGGAAAPMGARVFTASAAGNTVNYNGAAQVVQVTAYSHLGLGGSGAKTLTGVTTVGGNLILSGTATAATVANLAIGGNLGVGAGTALTVGAFNLGVTGATSVSGTLAHSSATGTNTYTGALTINSGGSLTNAGNAAISYAGGLVNNGSFASGTAAQTFTNGGVTHNGTVFTAGSGAFIFSSNAQAINCTGTLAIPSITVTAIAVTNNCNLTVTTALGGTGSFINAATGQLHVNFAGAMGIATLTAMAIGNLVDYNFAGAQTVKATTYHHLTLSGSGAKTMGATTVNGNFTMSGAATTTPTGALGVGGNFSIEAGTTFSAGAFNHTVGGNWSKTGTFAPGTGTVTLNGAAAQTISGTSPVNFNNLTVSNVASPNVTLASNVTVVGALAGTVTLTSTCPTDYTLTSTTPAQTLHSCPSVTPPANFNCVESGAIASTGHLYTKLAGTGFSFDVVALKADGTVETTYASAGNKDVTVELVDGTGATACASRTAINPAVSQILTFTKANQPTEQGRKPIASMAVNKAYTNLRCRVTDATATPIVGCSTDNFSVRPVSLALTAAGLGADATGTSATATPVVKAGASFTLTATASDTGYTGTPTIDGAALAAHSGANGVLAGTFAAATSGVASSTFNYDEAGYFRLNANGLLDATFTAVDNAAGDCTADFSTALSGGRYGCKIGSAATAYFGRFIPDHFDTAVVATAAGPMPCPAGLTCPALYNGFIYSGQPFSVRVIARNLAGGTTANYDGVLGLSKLVTLTAWDALGSTTTQNPGGGTLTNGFVASAVFSAGVAMTATPTYTLATALTAPTDIYLRALDADNVSSFRAAPVEGGVKVANGRIKFVNVHGSELLPLAVTATVQYYNGTAWLTSATDSLSSLVNANIALSAGTNGLSGCPATCPTSITPATIAFNNGLASLILSRPNVTGSVNMAVTAPANCAVNPAQAACYLGSNAARATFGVYKGNNEFIYLRENY